MKMGGWEILFMRRLHDAGRFVERVKKMKGQKIQMIPCDKDCYYQNKGYCGLDEIACITSCESGGCGYFTQTDPYAALSDDCYRLEEIPHSNQF